MQAHATRSPNRSILRLENGPVNGEILIPGSPPKLSLFLCIVSSVHSCGEGAGNLVKRPLLGLLRVLGT